MIDAHVYAFEAEVGRRTGQTLLHVNAVVDAANEAHDHIRYSARRYHKGEAAWWADLSVKLEAIMAEARLALKEAGK